ncbi:MAG: PKD domain-containing protein [Planctomycetota bacterium]|jgi:PKD repeat protein
MSISISRRSFLKVVGLSAASKAMPKMLVSAEVPEQKPKSESLIIQREAKDTLTAVELNCGETLRFKLLNGQTRQLSLHETSAEILLKGHGATLYHFTCRIAIDGHEMLMERYVGCQESFYEPYVINGMRIWFDAVADIFDFLREVHGKCKPAKNARFAVADASIPICPEEVKPWCPLARDFIDIKDCYNGDDCWLGAYHGVEAHGGLDINHPKGTELYTPISLDDQYLYNSINRGEGNNRWVGIRKWPNGDVWKIMVSHVRKLLHPQHQPLPAGVHFAEGAGVEVWAHDHSHFIFTVTGEDGQEIRLDPWIIFWQIFENNKNRKKEIRASMELLGPQKTGEAVAFSSRGCRKSAQGEKLTYYWAFGDGGFSMQPNPSYVYLKPGIYPVTLTVDDGMYRDTFTQHITVDGEQIEKSGFILTAPDEFTFRQRSVHMMDVYGIPPAFMPHTLNFTARPTRPKPDSKILQVKNSGGGKLGQVSISQIKYEDTAGWIAIEQSGKGNNQKVVVSVDASNLKPGTYSAMVEASCLGAVNSKQCFCVNLNIPDYEPPEVVTIDDNYIGFYATPYFWVGHRFHKWPCNGYNCFCLINGKRTNPGEFARFTSDLNAGTYQVFFPEIVLSWQDEESRFAVRVKHKNGIDTVWMEPKKSRSIGMWDHMIPNPTKLIGTFEFNEGTDGFVEILAEGSKGQVPADAVIFKKVT